jgi:hypothetical protein
MLYHVKESLQDAFFLSVCTALYSYHQITDDAEPIQNKVIG